MFTWGNVNSDFYGTDGSRYNTQNRIVEQIWHINGGANGAEGYVPGAFEDGTPYNIHSQTAENIAVGISTRQTPWKPRIYSPMKAMFDWGPSLGLNTTILSGGIQTVVSNPIPISPKLLGSETLLWEASPYHNIKYTLLRYKAPMRVENTYSAGKSSTSWYNTFTNVFSYLDKRVDILNTGVRLVESGLSKELSYSMKNDDETIIPCSFFANTLVLTFIKNDPTVRIYYTLTGSLSKYPIEAGNGLGLLENRQVSSIATLYTGPITITRYSPLLTNGLVCIKAQVYTSAGVPVGALIDRRYICMPFTLTIAGGMRSTNLEGRYGDESVGGRYFNENLCLTVDDVPSDGVVRYSVGQPLNSVSSVITPSDQLMITSSTDIVNVGFFDSNNLCCGKAVNLYAYSTQDNLTNVNRYLFTVRSSFNITTTFTTTSFTTIKNILSGVPNYPGGVKVTVTVVAGGGSGGSRQIVMAGSGGGGGGGGGISTEVYYNVSPLYTLYVIPGNAGQQSSIAFTPICLRGAVGAGNRFIGSSFTVNAYQDPIYPTVAYPGTSGSGSSRGTRGSISKGDVISRVDATAGSSGAHGIGGRGYTYNGVEYGAGGNGGATGLSGTQGIVIVNIQPI